MYLLVVPTSMVSWVLDSSSSSQLWTNVSVQSRFVTRYVGNNAVKEDIFSKAAHLLIRWMKFYDFSFVFRVIFMPSIICRKKLNFFFAELASN